MSADITGQGTKFHSIRLIYSQFALSQRGHLDLMRIYLLRGLLSVLSLAPLSSWALPSKPCPHKVKETITPPRGWTATGIPSPDHKIILRIGLPQPNFHILEKHLYEVSDPDHERYGDHLSKEETEALVAPHQSSIDAVNEWLEYYGLKETDLVRSPAKDWVTVTIPIGMAEEMLDTKYSVWKHTSGDQMVRTTGYSLPENLHEHIDVVQPTTMFGRFKRDRSTIVWPDEKEEEPVQKAQSFAPSIEDPVSGSVVDPSCNATITITCLKQLYNAVGFCATGSNNSIGVTGYLEEFANLQDLQSFYADQRPDALNSSFRFLSVKGGLDDQNISNAGAEANLDVQFAFGLSFPIPSTFYSTAGRPPFIPDVNTPADTNEPYTDWLDFVLARNDTPLVISTSYGDDEQTGKAVRGGFRSTYTVNLVPESFAIRACKGFAQLGVRGVSLLFSSGDSGVGDNDPNPATQQCFTNDGKNQTRFLPSFPTTVTAVGGTTNIPEVAVSRFFSGGGFSNYFDRPSYQDDAVTNYLAALPNGTYEGLFNPKGRAYPDVSAQSDRFRIFLSGKPILIGGTSASSPAFAGFVALLNDVRLTHGQRPMGFLNPFLYSKGANGLNDITVGHNSGCGTTGFNHPSRQRKAGIQVITIFPTPNDCLTNVSVTGLGTPNFGKLKELVL
ncbi:hypothetical protein C0992_010085 [Termitomyces sp. T32_za158]|nr:hypothetical protein C0992_010085 [Termitomyces sp. T32_za158]